jgi:hypothetical protein
MPSIVADGRTGAVTFTVPAFSKVSSNSTSSPSSSGSARFINIRWNPPGLSSRAPLAGTGNPPSFGCIFDDAPSVTTSCSWTICVMLAFAAMSVSALPSFSTRK